MSNVGNRKFVHLALQLVGIVLIVASSYSYYLETQKADGVEIDMIVKEVQFVKGEKKPWFPVYEYEIDGKIYQKKSEEGLVLETYKSGENVWGEYLEGIPESVRIGKLDPMKGKNTGGEIFLFCFGFILVSIPFIVKKVFGKI